MQRGLYRKTAGGMCKGCDGPTYVSKKGNPKRVCWKCLKISTERAKVKRMVMNNETNNN